MDPVTVNLISVAANLVLFAWGRHPINLGCVVISGAFAAAFYFYPAGLIL